jgi:N-hydroxyarylamine O-acetyltransferase
MGRRIELSDSYDKIVKRKRGGFCYELNGTFFHLLKVMGVMSPW